MGFSTTHATLHGTWDWQLVSRTGIGGFKAEIVSNKHSEHCSNFVPEVDLTWMDPAEIEAFADALKGVAAKIRADREDED